MTSADETAIARPPAITALMAVKAYRESYLNEAVHSMLGQTLRTWRLLVIVEGPDRAELEAVLADHLADPRISLIPNEGRKLAGALNTGMRHAESEFVAVLHGDDLWSPDAVGVLARSIAAHPETDFFHSSRRVIDEQGRPVSSVHPSRPDVTLENFGESSPVKPLLCWKRQMGLAVGGMDESLNNVGIDDFDFPWSMAEQGATFTAIPECLYLYRDHREVFRLTTHLPLNHHKREMARIMRKHGVEPSAIAAAIAAAERSYLRQCIYRSRPDRWLRGLRRGDGRRGWRETFR